MVRQTKGRDHSGVHHSLRLLFSKYCTDRRVYFVFAYCVCLSMSTSTLISITWCWILRNSFEETLSPYWRGLQRWHHLLSLILDLYERSTMQLLPWKAPGNELIQFEISSWWGFSSEKRKAHCCWISAKTWAKTGSWLRRSLLRGESEFNVCLTAFGLTALCMNTA